MITLAELVKLNALCLDKNINERDKEDIENIKKAGWQTSNGDITEAEAQMIINIVENDHVRRLHSLRYFPSVIDIFGKDTLAKILSVTMHFEDEIWSGPGGRDKINMTVDGANRWGDLEKAGVFCKVIKVVGKNKIIINLGYRRNRDGAGDGKEYLMTMYEDHIEWKTLAAWNCSWESIMIEYSDYCLSCGSVMTMRNGKFGPFMGCTSYPDCTNTFKYK